jgi:hypothetical protein
MNWYKKAQQLEVTDSDSLKGNRGKHYTDMGHDTYRATRLPGVYPENEKYNPEEPNYMWIFYKGEVQIKPETNLAASHRDPDAWGMDRGLDKLYTGRYSPSERTITVLPPHGTVSQFREIPSSLQYLLKQKFPKAERIVKY